MLFTLEALEARYGDCLLLHYEEEKRPRVAVIDGGPPHVFASSLKPRLDELRASRAHGGSLFLRLLMVSHIDEDHVKGILELAQVVFDCSEAGSAPPYEFPSLWHNSFGDLVKKVKISQLESVTATAAAAAAGTGGPPPAWLKALPPDSAAVAASVGQGRDLRRIADKLDCNLNPDFDDLVVATGGSDSVKSIGKNLKFTVLGPSRARLDALQNDWADKVAALKKKKKGKASEADLTAAAADFVDKSVYNLSSIVVLAESGKKTMLLTGDARGDDIIDGLKRAGKMPGGKCHVDLLKVPHHGSKRNVTQGFFEKVTADHYVISADGTYDNPDKETLQWLFAARAGANYAVHLTNPVPHAVAALKAEARKNGKLVVDVRADGKPSVVVDLGDPLKD